MAFDVNREALRRAAALGAFGAGAVLSLRALLKPMPARERTLIDWDAVVSVGSARSGESGARGVHDAGTLGRHYDEIAATLAPLMAEVCETAPAGFPHFTVLDRRGFIERNVVIVQRMLAPVEELRGRLPESRMTALGRRVTDRYMGEIFGFMSQRVLGQYDPVLSLAPAGDEAPLAALYLVEPNVHAFERSQHAPPEPLRQWLILHELTHAWQFESHPWLREHLVEQMREMLRGVLDLAPESGRGPSSREMLQRLPLSVRSQLRVVGRLQAVMSVLEGYSNFVMHRVGRSHIEHFDDLESAFHRRQTQRSVLERLVLAVTGMSMKMRQYEVGEKFADAVAAKGGITLLNRVWEAPDLMPTLTELREPQRWIARVG